MWRINKYKLYIFYFVSIIFFGSIGFYIIGGEEWSWLDSLYMTIITLFFVGFSEVHPLNDLGRIWAIVVIIFGVAGIGMLFASIRDIIIYFNTYRRIIMMNKIKKLNNHFIICGYGRIGAVIASELGEQNIPFIVIEKNEEKAEKIRASGMYCINGDATLDDTLFSASVENAKGIAVALNTDQDNLFVTMTIRSLNSEAFLLSRCAKDENKSKLMRSGANKVINPYVAGGHRMVEMLLHPEITDSIRLTTPNDESLDLNIDEIPINKIPSYVGKTIQNTEIRNLYDLIIVCVIKNDNTTIVNPSSGHIIDEGDTIMVIGDKKKLDIFSSQQTI